MNSLAKIRRDHFHRPHTSGYSLADLRAISPKPRTASILHDDWALQSSCKISAPGAKISALGFPTDGWHKTTVPSTVVAALVADKTYPDPLFRR